MRIKLPRPLPLSTANLTASQSCGPFAFIDEARLASFRNCRGLPVREGKQRRASVLISHEDLTRRLPLVCCSLPSPSRGCFAESRIKRPTKKDVCADVRLNPAGHLAGHSLDIASLSRYTQVAFSHVKRTPAHSITQPTRICKPEVRGSIPLCSTIKTEGQNNVLAFFVGLTGMRPA